ncbi:MAG TPA: hypothetical protein VFV34_20920 [Blastocatellia bacterium]|nr:hypothetical protein [Blastocatellia bacterium]
MSDTNLLSFTVRSITSKLVEIEIKNVSDAHLAKELRIEIQLPAALVDPRLRAAVEKAPLSPSNMASVADIVTVGGGLSVWVFNNTNENLVALRVGNDLDQQTGTPLASPVTIAADAAFVIAVPLTKQVGAIRVTAPYSYKHGGRGSQQFTGSIDLILEDTGQWKPKVSLSIDRPNPTMLEPGRKVKISWSVADGVSATLRGPLPGGHSELRLSKDPNSDFRIDQGSLEIYAVGQATYFLDAQVLDPKKEQNVQVIRTLFLDTKSGDKFASLRLRPNKVLSGGLVDIDWAVWGVEKATIGVGNRLSLELTLTEQDLSGTYQGTGVWPVKASRAQESVTLTIDDFEPQRKFTDVAGWEQVDPPPGYTGEPLGLAVAPPHMAMLTTDGLWIATVGNDDRDDKNPLFRKVATDAPKAWLALTAFEQGFVVLRQTPRDRLQLARYGADGKEQGVPLDLRTEFASMFVGPKPVFDLVAFGKRVYVCGEHRYALRSDRQTVSVRFDPEEMNFEFLLDRLEGYRLLPFANALYALNPNSGQMLRLGQPEAMFRDGSGPQSIQHAYKAASAAKNGRSLIRGGLLVPLGTILVVLDPRDLPDLASLVPAFPASVADFAFKENSPAPQADDSQDLIYNPQKDEWTACGQGLEVKLGAVAAFRGGPSKRLWVLQADGKMARLAGATESLFERNYVEKFPPKTLLPALNAKKVIKIKNDSGWPLGRVELYGLSVEVSAFSCEALSEVKPGESNFEVDAGATRQFEIAHHKTDPSPVKLRFATYPGQLFAYFVEVTLSGLGLSNISSVFKCAFWEMGRPAFCVTEVPGSLVQHTDSDSIVIPHPSRIDERYKLMIFNRTPFAISFDSDTAPMEGYREIEINYKTNPIQLYSPSGRAGILTFRTIIVLPHGIEFSSGDVSQQSLLRLDCIHWNWAMPYTNVLKPGDRTMEVEYLLNGQKKRLTVAAPARGATYVCQIVENR